MNRRQILSSTGVGLLGPLAGCANNGIFGLGTTDAVTPGSPPSTELDDNCSPAELPLSDLLTDERGRPDVCFEGATPSLVIENERAESLTVTVDIDQGDAITGEYDLDPNERLVEPRALEARSSVTGTVSVEDGDEQQVRWPKRSCNRHGIALTPDGVEIGWVKSLWGAADTQHDCYPGDEITLVVASMGKARTITVAIADLCANSTITNTFELDADESTGADFSLRNGGMYDVGVTVDTDRSETYEFREVCVGIGISVEADGVLHVGEPLID